MLQGLCADNQYLPVKNAADNQLYIFPINQMYRYFSLYMYLSYLLPKSCSDSTCLFLPDLKYIQKFIHVLVLLLFVYFPDLKYILLSFKVLKWMCKS